jgi:hypothetical protein
MRSRALASVVLATMGWVASEVPAGADDGVASPAVEVFNAGKALEARGDYPAACQKFAESARLDARVGTFARLAQCEEKLGLAVHARSHWAQARDLAHSLHDARADHAEREYARVDALVPKLRFVLAGRVPPGLILAVDGNDVGEGALAAPVPVDAGLHTIRAEAPGKRAFSVSVTTQADGAVTLVEIDLADAQLTESPTPTGGGSQAQPMAAASARALARSDSAPRWGSQKTVAVVTGGLGVIAAGVGTYFGLRSFSRWSDAKQQCGGGCGPDDPATTAKADAHSAAIAADIAFGAAGVLLAGAGVLWFTAPQSSAKESAQVLVAPIGGSATGVAVSGRFGP